MKKEKPGSEKKEMTDYSVYCMSLSEKLMSLAAGAAGGTAAGFIFFGPTLLCAAAGAAGTAAGIRAGRNYFRKKRDRILMIQFRDFLESVSVSLSSGQNISDAVNSAGQDMKSQYGADSMIFKEISAISSGMRNGHTAEEMLSDFGRRSCQHDIKCFSDTFSVCYRTGGNMKQVISGAYRIISDKMQMQSEIAAAASKGKNDLRIMTCLPLIIIPLVNSLGGTVPGHSGPADTAVKAAGAAVIAAAYILGMRLTEIKI